MHRPPPATTYGFVDAGHLRSVVGPACSQIYGETSGVDYRLLQGVEETKRLFVYDCLPTIQTPSQSEQQFDEALAEASTSMDEIAALPFVHVRRGKMYGAGRSRKQKEIDVGLAVDALTHAFRGNMDHAVVITADADFTPLLRALVEAGTYVTLVGRNPSKDLQLAADVFHALDAGRITRYAFGDHGPHSHQGSGSGRSALWQGVAAESVTPRGSGTIGDRNVMLGLLNHGTYGDRGGHRRWIVAAGPSPGASMRWEGYVSARPGVAANAFAYDAGAPIEWDATTQPTIDGN
jgi:uncharacterized LabA/DUF88 family protein